MQRPVEFESVYSGTRARASELSLVLEARGVRHEVLEQDGACGIWVPPEEVVNARFEFDRYGAESVRRRELPPAPAPLAGAWIGAGGYIATLLMIGYLAGQGALQVNWFAYGGLDHHVIDAGQWWRSVTALTLHVDQAHVMGNLLFGVGFGLLAGRVFGPGIAWLGIVLAATVANLLDVLIAPSSHRAVGASTAVFAALGMLTGYAWHTRFVHLGPRERWLRRSTPVIAGLGLLVLLGDSAEHVDVIGHICGFICGTAAGWMLSLRGLPRTRAVSVQWLCGGAALAIVLAAWGLALQASFATSG